MDATLNTATIGFIVIICLLIFMKYFPSCAAGCESKPDPYCKDSVNSFVLNDHYSAITCSNEAIATWQKTERDGKINIIATCTCPKDSLRIEEDTN